MAHREYIYRNLYKYINKTSAFKDFYLGFNLFFEIKNLFERKQKKEENQEQLLPYCFWGGLCLHTDLIQELGYAKEELFLYCDDIEYTSRILKNGAKIIYLPEQKIIDTDQSFTNSHKKPNPLLD
jgi:GT2 family glycosyltransferase